MTRTFPIALIAIAMIAGFTSQVQQERVELLGQPIECASATGAMTALAGAIPETGERLSSEVRLVLPASRVIGAGTGQLGDRSAIASGRPEEQFRALSAENDAACGTAELTYETGDMA